MKTEAEARPSVILRGLGYGAAAGLVASEIFMVGLCLFGMATMVTSGQSALTSLNMLAYLLLGQLYGTLPAIFIGGVCGTLIGLVFRVMNCQLPSGVGIAFGLCLAFITLVAAIVVFYALNHPPSISPSIVNPTSVALLLPMLVLYLASGAWVGHKLTR